MSQSNGVLPELLVEMVARHPLFVLMIPTRRDLTLPWLALVGEIGKDSGHGISENLAQKATEARPKVPVRCIKA